MKTRIAFISEHASPLATLGGVDSGGQNVYVAELAKYLSRQGFDVDIFTRLDDERQEKIVHWIDGIRVIHVKAGAIKIMPKESLLGFMPEFRDEMISFIAAEKIHYTLIHAHFFMSAWVACELKKLLGIPFVVTFHALGVIRRIHQKGNDSFPKERLLIEYKAIEMADRVIAECTQDKDDLVVHYDADPQKISIIPCGFCPDSFYPVDKVSARKITGLDPNEKIILQLGRMVPRKGVDNVIKAMVLLKNVKQKIRLVIVGGESEQPDPVTCPEIGRLQNLAKELGVDNITTFVGRKNREQLKYYYSAADIFVTTPWYEPFGITPLESMACGTPVVGANVGGIKYSVAEGRTGFLVPPNNHEALASKLSILLSDEELLDYMKQNCLLRVNALFTWAKIAEKTIFMYEHVIHPMSAKKVIPIWTRPAQTAIPMNANNHSIVLNSHYAKSSIR